MDHNNNFAPPPQQQQQPQGYPPQQGYAPPPQHQQPMDQQQQHQQPYEQQPHPQQQPAATQGQRPEKSDVDHWVNRLNYAAANSHTVTNQPGDAPWSSGFFDCFNPIDNCLLTCCCPCVAFSRTHHRLHKDKNLAGWSFINATCIGWYVTACFGVHCIGNILQRNEIRDRSSPKLAGDFATDCLKAWCCSCCDMMQQEKEAQLLLAKESGAVNQQPTAHVQQMSYEPKH